jgi:hypothetical protein
MVKRVVLNCCGYKRCPEASLDENGSLEIVDQDDGRNARIVLAPEQVDKLRELLAERAGGAPVRD